jgi:quercetin dioxygenase-like cupin family protein
MRMFTPVLTVLFLSSGALAGDESRILQSSEMKWGDTGEPFPNTQAAVVNGDPSKEGAFIMRWRCPDNYRIAPHVHPATEEVTVVQGTFLIGEGDKFQDSNLKAVKQGGFMSMPGGKAHYGMCKGTTVLEIHAMGPWGTTMLAK